MFNGRLLQIFNRYVHYGGEEAFCTQLQDIIGPEQIQTCWFDSKEWLGPAAPPKWKQSLLIWNNPAALQRIREHHRAWKPDAWLLGNVYPVASAGVYRLALQEKIPVFHFAHNFRPFSVNGTLWAGGQLCDAGLRRNFWPEIRRRSWQNSLIKTAWMAGVLTGFHGFGWSRAVTAWLTVSDFLREKFIEAGVPATRIFTVKPFWLAQPALPTAAGEDYFFFVGRLIEEKGVRVLLNAWKEIFQQRGTNGPGLKIAGRGPLEAVVRQAAAQNPLVQSLGFVSDEEKARLLARCRAVITPSISWEPLGIVTCEAYDAGKPVLGARTGGITETIQHGVTGLLHNPGDAAELARHVLELNNAPERRQAMGLAGREWLVVKMAPERWRKELFQIIELVLHQNKK